MDISIDKRRFGTSCTGEPADLWTIDSPCGISLSLTNWGAAIVRLIQPDRTGRKENVVLGFDDASKYLPGNGYFGVTCGRFANRIAKGTFTLDGNTYKLNCNEAPNHLHGGVWGFHARLWDAEPFSENEVHGIEFSRYSPDGEEGYPGELLVKVRYGLDKESRLYMNFQATTDKPTIINLTNHSYWNLSGNFQENILNTGLEFNATHYVPLDTEHIPLGTMEPLDNTPYDFRQKKTIGQDMHKAQDGGYDIFVTDGHIGELRVLANAWDPLNGRKLTLLSDRSGLQFYTGNNLDGSPFPKHSGFCLEPQDIPDAPNKPLFPSTVLRPGEFYNHHSIVEFSTLPGA